MRFLLAVMLGVACAAPPPAPDTTPPRAGAEASPDGDPLGRLGLRASTGAAPGYVADSGCGLCHARLYESYQGVGMARSMARPRSDNRIEDFGTPYFHEPSQRYYEMAWSGERLLFRRWQLDEDGQRIHRLELPVDWIVGSGYRSRVYLYRTLSGELYQLPIAWYPQAKGWGMAPGFDRADHEGVERRVRRECLFCHNGYPEVAEGADAAWAPQTFPESLPEGTGCQRCHGPGAEHIRAVLEGGSQERLRGAIVNPARLPPERRDSVCFQCHMLPAVEMIGVRRFARGDYSFRAGELLSDYIVHVDVDEPDRPRSERFEINHHAYRLVQSPCHQLGKLGCTDCHDPHQPLRSDSRLAGVNGVCLRCHERHEIVPLEGAAAIADDECARCHMPRRRTQDVVHVTMTDHRIGVAPAGDLLAPLEEREADIEGLAFHDPATAPSGTSGEIYRAVTVLRANGRLAPARAYLENALPDAGLATAVPWLDLISAELQQQRFAQAEHAIGFLTEPERSEPLATGWLGIAKVGAGRTTDALADLRKAAAEAPDMPEAQFNLGLVLHQTGSHEEALELLGRALELRPNLVAAWFTRAAALEALGRDVEAIADLRRALEIRPTEARAYTALARLLRETGATEESERVIRQGLQFAKIPQ